LLGYQHPYSKYCYLAGRVKSDEFSLPSSAAEAPCQKASNYLTWVTLASRSCFLRPPGL